MIKQSVAEFTESRASSLNQETAIKLSIISDHILKWLTFMLKFTGKEHKAQTYEALKLVVLAEKLSELQRQVLFCQPRSFTRAELNTYTIKTDEFQKKLEQKNKSSLMKITFQLPER